MKKILKSKIFRYVVIDLLIGGLIFVAMLYYQKSTSLLAIINSIQVSGFLLFAFGWIFLIHNEGLFDVATYGVVYFIKGIFGAKMEKSLYETMQEKTKVPKSIFITLWIVGIIFIGVSFLLYLI